jgi:hypothetical protein
MCDTIYDANLVYVSRAAKISKRRNRQKCAIGRQKCTIGRPRLCGCAQTTHLSFPEKGFPVFGTSDKTQWTRKALDVISNMYEK